MNKIKLIVIALLLAGCQVIPEDQQLLPLPNAEPVSNALLVEFTGFLCVNCPTAAEEAQSLHETYPDNLVVVAMHPADNHFTQTTLPQYDYTCPEANVYYRHFGGSGTTPFPTGIVDMQQGWLDFPSWPTAVLTSVMQEKEGRLELEISEVNESERRFTVSAGVFVDSSYPAVDNEAVVELMLWLVADSVTGAQMMPDGSTNLEYTHRHMLRASLLEDPWGTFPTIVTGSKEICPVVKVNYQVTDSIGGKELPLSDYSIVGVLVEPETKKLMDVQQKKIMD